MTLAHAPAVHADANRFGPFDVRTMFVIGKNLDRNEVQYGIRLDKDCVPVGDEPVYAYWRQFEKGPEVTEDLNFLDKQGYGIAGQWVKVRSVDGSRVTVSLRATSERGISVFVKKLPNGKCSANAVTTVENAPARLEKIFVHVAGWLKIDWLEITGYRANGDKVVEHINR